MISRIIAALFLGLVHFVAVAQPFSLQGFPGNSVFPPLLVDTIGSSVRVQLIPYDGLLSYGGRLDCEKTRVVVQDRLIDVTVYVQPGDAEALCERDQTIEVGKLSAGSWELRIAPSGWTTPPYSYLFEVAARGVVCNANPENRTVRLTFREGRARPFLDRLAADPAWHAFLGNLSPGPLEILHSGQERLDATFDPLVDPLPIIDALRRSEDFAFVGWSAGSCGFPECPGNPDAEATEFRRTDRDRFIFVTDPTERDALDSGAIAGWARTGEHMRVLVQGAAPAREGLFHPVFRFWGGSVTHEPSHFFTASQTECAVLRDRPEWNWTFERSGFWAYEWKAEGCLTGVPLYRAYNNGLDGAPAHRYSTKRSVIDEMLARGWVDEGPVMCVAGP